MLYVGMWTASLLRKGHVAVSSSALEHVQLHFHWVKSSASVGACCFLPLIFKQTGVRGTPGGNKGKSIWSPTTTAHAVPHPMYHYCQYSWAGSQWGILFLHTSNSYCADRKGVASKCILFWCVFIFSDLRCTCIKEADLERGLFEPKQLFCIFLVITILENRVKLVILKISVLVDLTIPVVTGGNSTCGLILQIILFWGSKTHYYCINKEFGQ